MNLEKICKYIIFSGIFLIPFIAFLLSQNLFFPYITLKNFAFRIIVEIMFGAWALLALYVPRFRLNMSKISIAIASFLGIMLVANLLGENISRSFWSNYERMEGFVTLLHLGAYFVVLASVMTSEKMWKRLFATTLLASAIMALFYALPELGKAIKEGAGIRLSTTLGNPIYLAVYALFHIFIGWIFALRYAQNRVTKNITWMIVALNTFVLYYTATRGDLLGLMVGAGAVALLVAFFGKRESLGRKVALGAIVSMAVLVSGFSQIKDTEFVQTSPVLSRFSQISLEDNTTKARLMVWGMALEGWKERPVLGWGQENFNIVFNKYYNPQMYAQEPFFDRAHNAFLDWLIAGGALGLLAYLLIFGAVLYVIWKRAGGAEEFSFVEKSVLTGLLAAYFFQNLLVFDNIISYILFFTILAYIHTITTPQEDSDKRHIATTPVDVVAPIIIVVTILVVHVVNTKAILTNRHMIEGMSSQAEGIPKNIEHFKKAIAYDTFGKIEAREHLTQLARKVSSMAQVPDVQKQEILEFARKEIIKQAEELNNDARESMIAGSFLRSVGLFDDSIKYLERALVLSPNKQQIMFEFASVYLNKDEPEKSLELARRAYKLAPEYADALKIYAAMAIYTNNYKLAEELLVPKYGTIAIPDERMTLAFVKVGDYKNVVAVWEARIAELQSTGLDNPQYHVSLAAAYLEIDRRKDAISELEKAIGLNPAFKQQGEYYINEIKEGRNP